MRGIGSHLVGAWRQHILRLSKQSVYLEASHQDSHLSACNKVPNWTESTDVAFQSLSSGSTICVEGVAHTPTPLIDKLCEYVANRNLDHIAVYSLLAFGPLAYYQEQYNKHFIPNVLFAGPSCKQAIATGKASYIPILLNDMPKLMRHPDFQLDMLIMSVSPPDKFGYCSLGASCDMTLSAVESANTVVALVNPLSPVTYGMTQVHCSNFDYLIPGTMALHQVPKPIQSAEETEIGRLIAENLVDDEATLQMGIGSIPDATLLQLTKHRDLGVHTEMFSDGLITLSKCGALTNAKKSFLPGVTIASFVIGTDEVYKFIDGNPSIEMHECSFTNRPEVIAKNSKMVAINSCIEIDITGQVVSDSIGTRIYSGFGGQVDFIRGAGIAHDEMGKPIIAMTSLTTKGQSKIVTYLKKGAGIVTPRDHTRYVVTEYGIANLFGKNLRQRAFALIQIAHPTFRETLEKQAFEMLRVMPSSD